MSRILCGTHWVNTEEPCLNLVEMNLVRPEHPEMHRYMILTVMRGDKPEEFWMDLGPAKQFNRPQFRIPGGARDDFTGRFHVVHTVGELVDMANQLREGPFEQPEPPKNRPDLQQLFYDQPDIRRKNKKKVSTFGPGSVLQRS